MWASTATVPFPRPMRPTPCPESEPSGMLDVMRDARCLLFFPGTRTDLLPKALASGAPLVCADLEDAVAPSDKAAAREQVRELLAAADLPIHRISVRINHPSTPAGDDDLRMLVEASARAVDSEAATPVPSRMLIPKVDGPDDVAAVRERWSSVAAAPELVAAIESPRGVARVEDIAEADGVGALLFGGLDLSLELGAALDWDSLLYARSRAVVAARIAGVPVMDTPSFDLSDQTALTVEAKRARSLGFDGKAAIHPRQVPWILAAFSPSETEVAAAKRIVEAAERAGRGVFALDGVMVDRPMVEAARRVVRATEETPRGDVIKGGA